MDKYHKLVLKGSKNARMDKWWTNGLKHCKGGHIVDKWLQWINFLRQGKMDKWWIIFVGGIFVHYLSNILTVVHTSRLSLNNLRQMEAAWNTVPSCAKNLRIHTALVKYMTEKYNKSTSILYFPHPHRKSG